MNISALIACVAERRKKAKGESEKSVGHGIDSFGKRITWEDCLEKVTSKEPKANGVNFGYNLHGTNQCNAVFRATTMESGNYGLLWFSCILKGRKG